MIPTPDIPLMGASAFPTQNNFSTYIRGDRRMGAAGLNIADVFKTYMAGKSAGAKGGVDAPDAQAVDTDTSSDDAPTEEA